MKNLSKSIATTRDQSERLLAMGVKPETADMYWMLDKMSLDMESELSIGKCSVVEDKWTKYTPSWSLSRLISIIPSEITVNKKCGSLFISHIDISYFGFESDKRISFITGFTKGPDENLFDICIDMIDWLIKNNHFNKGYLR